MDLIQLSSDPQVLQSTSIKIVTKPAADGAANITSGQIEPGLSDNTGAGTAFNSPLSAREKQKLVPASADL